MIDQHKLIDDYVKGLLNNNEKATFELELENNKDLQEEVNFRKAIVHHFKFEQIKNTIEQAKFENANEAKTEAKLENVAATIKQAKFENTVSRQKRIRLYRNLSIAALFSVIIGGGWFANVLQNDDLFTDIIITELELQKVTTVNVEKIKGLVAKANQAIKDTDFDLALSITEQLRNEEGFETDEMLQNESYIFFKQQNYAKADRQVDRIKNNELQNKIRWQLSTLYLDAGEVELAKQHLQKIQEGTYRNKAVKKLKKLN